MEFNVETTKNELGKFIAGSSSDLTKYELKEEQNNLQEVTLKEWLHTCKNRVEKIQVQNICEYRLARDLRHILRDIMRHLYYLHKNSRSHGHVSTSKVCVLRCDERFEGRGCRAVLLAAGVDNRNARKCNDWLGLQRVIEEMLHTVTTDWPKDVRHLYDLLGDEDRCIWMSDGFWQFHPCVWEPNEFHPNIEKMFDEIRVNRNYSSAVVSNFHGRLRNIHFSVDREREILQDPIWSSKYNNELQLPLKDRALETFTFVRHVFTHGFNRYNAQTVGVSSIVIKDAENKLYCFLPDFLCNFVEKMFPCFEEVVFMPRLTTDKTVV